jgi:flavin reductase (DIM6/NTAB) family NADH-FMN oxidoreductase RutF
VNRGSVAHAAIRENGLFTVNLLSTHQQAVSDAFAGRPARGRAYDFDDGQWRVGPSGAPRLTGAVAVFECALEQAHDAGSHTVFIGRVTSVTAGTGEALLYTGRAYGRALRWTQDRGAPSTTRTERHPAVA